MGNKFFTTLQYFEEWKGTEKNKVEDDSFPAGIYLLEGNNRNTRTRCKICSKVTIKIPERRYWRRSGIFIFNFENISHLVLVVLLLTLPVGLLLLLYRLCSEKHVCIFFRNGYFGKYGWFKEKRVYFNVIASKKHDAFEEKEKQL